MSPAPVVYCFDTNSLLTAWRQTYRPANFPGFWERLDELIASGRGVISDDVGRELSAKNDEVSGWVKKRSHCIVPLDDEQIVLVRALTKAHPKLAQERLGRKRADGFVIALAQQRDLTVVTFENNRGPDKIPNICEAHGVRCIGLSDMIEAERWSFA